MIRWQYSCLTRGALARLAWWLTVVFSLATASARDNFTADLVFPFVVAEHGEAKVYEQPDLTAALRGKIYGVFIERIAVDHSSRTLINQHVYARIRRLMRQTLTPQWLLLDLPSSGMIGWVLRQQLWLPEQIPPIIQWPIRQWLVKTTHQADANVHPFLIRVPETGDMYYQYVFRPDGVVLDPHSGKPSDYRVYLLNAQVGLVALGPISPQQRFEGAPWYFLGYYSGNAAQPLCIDNTSTYCTITPDNDRYRSYLIDYIQVVSQRWRLFDDDVRREYSYALADEAKRQPRDCLIDCPHFRPLKWPIVVAPQLDVGNEALPTTYAPFVREWFAAVR